MTKKEKLDTDLMASELSESAYFHPTSGQVDKPAKPLVEKYTTHLLPSTIKAIKKFAFEYDLNDYDVVQVAITEFLELRRFAFEHDLKPKDVQVALREFLDQLKEKK